MTSSTKPEVHNVLRKANESQSNSSR